MEDPGAVKLPYPKSIPFILTTEFCERFSYYGMRAILALFVNQILGWSETDASVLFHGFTVLAYLTPILGAILADSYIGKFNTIFYVSLIYGVGQMLMTLGSVGDTTEGNEGIENLPTLALVIGGLALVGIGTGGIKPCVATFGGEQFEMPQQKKQCELFFSIFYWAVNLGSFISMMVTPQLRSQVACLGQDVCYPLAFAVPAVLMFAAIAVFLLGRVLNMYKMVLPDRTLENPMKRTVRCIWAGLWAKKVAGETHFLDRAEPEFGRQFVDDCKALWNVAYMMLPFPIFWALFDQQGSRWTFQAARMNGNLFNLITFQPDSMQVTNAVLILIMVPVFNAVVYPPLAKCRLLRTNLQRIGTGFFMAALAFGISGLVELQLEKTYPNLPAEGQGQLIVYKMGLQDCDLSYRLSSSADFSQQFNISSGEFTTDPFQLNLEIGEYKLNIEEGCGLRLGSDVFNVTIKDEECSSLYFYNNEGTLAVGQTEFENQIDKDSSSLPTLKVIWTGLGDLVGPGLNASLVLKKKDSMDDTADWETFELTADHGDTEADKIRSFTTYKAFLTVDGKETDLELNDLEFKQGGNYNLLIPGNLEDVQFHQVTPENTLSMFWQFPQYFIMTAGEILFSITTMEFCFSQAPVTLKAVMLGMRYLTNAAGNIIDIVVMKAFEGAFASQAYEYFLFAGLTLVMNALFVWMSFGYKYVDYTGGEKKQEEKEKEEEKEEEAKGKENPALEDD